VVTTYKYQIYRLVNAVVNTQPIVLYNTRYTVEMEDGVTAIWFRYSTTVLAMLVTLS